MLVLIVKEATMKKLTAGLICAVMMLTLAFASFADVTVENRQAADSVNISNDAENAGPEIELLYNEGVHVFDTAELLTDEEKTSLEDKLSSVETETGFTAAVFTSYGSSGAADEDDFADMIFYYGELGKGEDKDGTILVIDMEAREVYIYTHGLATRYITDSMINYIYDDLDGGLYNSLGDADYAEACNIFAAGVLEAYRGGISSDQQNYNTQTGEYDPYVARRKYGLTLFEVIASLLISGIIGIIPVNSVKKKYAMKKEKALAERFNLSYRADAVYAFSTAASAAKLLYKHVSSMPIPRPQPTGGGGGGSHGGGISSGSIGRGGSFHGGGGRKF